MVGFLGTTVQRQLKKIATGDGIAGIDDGKMAVIIILCVGTLSTCIYLCRRKYLKSLAWCISDEIGDASQLKYMFKASCTPSESRPRAHRPEVLRPDIESPSPSFTWRQAPLNLSKIRVACRLPQAGQPRIAGTAVSDAIGVSYDHRQPPQSRVVAGTSVVSAENASAQVSLPRLLGQECVPTTSKPKSHKKGKPYKTKVDVSDRKEQEHQHQKHHHHQQRQKKHALLQHLPN